MRISFAVTHNVNRAADRVGAMPAQLKSAMRDATPDATRALESVVEGALVRKAGGAFWPVRSEAGEGRAKVLVSRSKPHRIEPTKPHGILANPATGFFSKGGVDHPGSNPPRNLLPFLESSPLREVERPYSEAVGRIFGGL